jgi:penicillin-binding protein 1A
VGALAASLAFAAWAGALAWGNSSPGRALLRERAGKALEKRLGPVEIGEAGLDLLLRARLAPVTLLGRGASGPVLRADRVVVRPRLGALLTGRVEPAAVALRGVRIWPGQDGSELGPLDLFVEFDGRDPVALRVMLAGGGHLDATARRGEDGVTFRVEGALSLPGDLPPALAGRISLAPASGRLAVRASGRAARDGAGVDVEVDLQATDVTFEGPRVGPLPLGPLALGASGRLNWDGPSRRLALAGGKVTLGESGEVAASVDGELLLGSDPRFSISARAVAVPWRSLVEALPPDLGPPGNAPLVSGNLSARASVAGSFSRRGEWDVQADLDIDDLRRSARSGASSWLASGFEWTPIDPGPDERPRRIAVGPGNPAFVPYPEIPQLLVRAVTASEDAGFFGHRGFDFREIANAVADPSRVRGASTISQQLSKNLFLSPERTLGRKVREALGTIALEASLPKGRLIEIYLNIAEWGPGVYGVGEAARFWFGKDARELTARESAFLATVIPGPRRFHARLHRSGISPWWNARIDDILTKMRVQNQLTDAELAAALVEPLDPLGREHPVGEDAGEPELSQPDDEPGSGPAYLSR